MCTSELGLLWQTQFALNPIMDKYLHHYTVLGENAYLFPNNIGLNV